MRTVHFRDILWGVARKAGYSPESGNFLTNQAIPIGAYIQQWTERIYAQQDWPEWVHTLKVVPINHVVPYDVIQATASGTTTVSIDRVIKVYLVDPTTTNVPIETHFTLLDDGIHCGYEHGTYVWIRYIEPTPKFTAITWQAQNTYAKGDTVYSPNTGDCYASLVDYNTGHDPSQVVSTPPPNQIPTQEVQSFVPPSLGSVAQSKIIKIDVKHMTDGVVAADPPAIGAVFTIPVLDNTGSVLATATYTVSGADTLSNVVTQLTSQLTSGLGGGWTVTADTLLMTITITHASDFFLLSSAGLSTSAPTYKANSGDSSHVMTVLQLQSYTPATSAAAVTQQVTTVTLSGDQIVPGSTYTATFVDGQGVQHQAQYASGATDSSQDVILGIANAIQTAATGDTFLAGITVSYNLSSGMFTFSSSSEMGVHVTRVRPGSPWWQLLPFPERLMNTVIRGAGADFLAEWGQSDKGMMEEQKVPLKQEVDSLDDDITPTLTPTYTSQQIPKSRYKY